MKSIVHTSVFSFICVLGFASVAQGQYGPVGPYGTPATGSQAVVVAQQQVRTAQEQVDRLERQAREELIADPAYSAAQQELNDATARRDAVKAEVLDALKGSPAYSQAVSQLEAAEALLHGDLSLSERQIVTATDDAIDARLAISRLESEALNGSADYRNAEARVTFATNQVDRLWRQYKAQNLTNNRTYRLAQTQLEDAQADLRDAQSAVRIARQQAALQQAMQPRQRTRQSSGEGGTRTRSSRASRY